MKKIMVSFRLEHYWIDKVEDLAKKYNTSRSEIIRTFVKGAIEGLENKEKK